MCLFKIIVVFCNILFLNCSSAPKGRSPAHRQVRHQRNARRILDSWMADDDSAQSRSNGKLGT